MERSAMTGLVRLEANLTEHLAGLPDSGLLVHLRCLERELSARGATHAAIKVHVAHDALSLVLHNRLRLAD